VDLRRQLAAPQGAARAQVPPDEVVRGRVQWRTLTARRRPTGAAPRRWPRRPAPAAAAAEKDPAVVGLLLAEAEGRDRSRISGSRRRFLRWHCGGLNGGILVRSPTVQSDVIDSSIVSRTGVWHAVLSSARGWFPKWSHDSDYGTGFNC
jgi:hypothetical protein